MRGGHPETHLVCGRRCCLAFTWPCTSCQPIGIVDDEAAGEEHRAAGDGGGGEGGLLGRQGHEPDQGGLGDCVKMLMAVMIMMVVMVMMMVVIKVREGNADQPLAVAVDDDGLLEMVDCQKQVFDQNQIIID